jgi:hypothetical protein
MIDNMVGEDYKYYTAGVMRKSSDPNTVRNIYLKAIVL